MSLKLKEEIRNLHVLNTLMEDDSNVNIDLKSLATNMKMEICGAIHYNFFP
jgi:hypothetical protein